MEAPQLNATPQSQRLPRITIQFCTQCKWMLRAAYFAQELLSTFSTSLGEVALIPSTGGIFTIDITYAYKPQHESQGVSNEMNQLSDAQTTRLWDRKADGGFPETKAIKQLVRDIIDPSRDLGHVDRQKIAKLDVVESSKSKTDEKRGIVVQPTVIKGGGNEDSSKQTADEGDDACEGCG